MISFWPCVALLCLLVSASSYAAIFGDNNPNNGIEDERQLPPPELSLATGTIYCDGMVRGTATHIHHKKISRCKPISVILSAAHVLFDPDSGQPFKTCHYHPQHQRLNAIPFASISAHRFNPKAEDKIAQSEADFVFIALKRPANQPTLRLSTQSAQRPHNLSLLGYNPQQDQLSLSKNCRSFDSRQFQNPALLYHDCDAEGGASGGPVFLEGSNKVIAIHGGTLFVRHSLKAGAKANPENWINQARKVDGEVISQLEQLINRLE